MQWSAKVYNTISLTVKGYTKIKNLGYKKHQSEAAIFQLHMQQKA